MKFKRLQEVVRLPEKKKVVPLDLNTIIEAKAPTAENSDMEQRATAEKVPEFKASGATMDQTVNLFEKVFRNMKNKRDFKQFAGLLLQGDPGTGKTTRIVLLGKLLGMELITVEAPHIAEEHIIHLPFLVRDPITDKETAGSTAFDQFKVVLADSNLFSKIKNVKKVSDAEYIKSIYNSTDDVVALYEHLGGSKTEIPEDIKELRETYNCILFLDEFLRNTSSRIRNLLRGILNGRIGSHAIPKSVFIVYATNMNDEGIDEIQQNMQFGRVKMKNPSKDEWFSYLVLKFKKDKHIQLKPNLINRFHHLLDDEHLSHNSIDEMGQQIRTSPRRWEQLLLYINAALPCKDAEDAISLMTNVKTNFRDYLSGGMSDIAIAVLKATATLIKETSNIEISHMDANSPSEWRKTLEHQFEVKKKLGDKRKYVPIVSGAPGIGKTAEAAALAKKLDLRFIDISADTLNAEDMQGIPIAHQKGADEIETHFSLPALYQYIMKRIKEEDKDYLEALKEKDPKDFAALKKEYEARDYKYLIFFDEFNRTNLKVFNAIRQVVLEKNFGPADPKSGGAGKKLELPKEALMVGAINPDDAGTQELTSHMKDVLDIIHSEASWDKEIEYLKDQKVPGADDLTHDIVLDVVKRFAHKFGTKATNVAVDQRPFHLDLGQDVYISAREYTQLFIAMTRALHDKMKKIKKIDISSLDKKAQKKLEDDVRRELVDSFDENVGFVLDKHGKSDDEFLRDVKNWIMHDQELNIGENLFYKKAYDKKAHSLVDILGASLDGAAEEGSHQNPAFINYIKHVSPNGFSEDLFEVLASRITDEKSANKYVLDQKYPIKRLNAKDKDIETDSSEKVSLLMNFFLEIIFAMYLNNQSFDKIEKVGGACTKTMKRFEDEGNTGDASKIKGLNPEVASEIVESSLDVRINIQDAIDQIQDAEGK